MLRNGVTAGFVAFTVNVLNEVLSLNAQELLTVGCGDAGLPPQ